MTTTGSGLRIGDGQPNTDLVLLYNCCLDTLGHTNIFGVVPGRSGWLIPTSAEMNEILKTASLRVGGRGAPGRNRTSDLRFRKT